MAAKTGNKTCTSHHRVGESNNGSECETFNDGVIITNVSVIQLGLKWLFITESNVQPA